MDEETGKALFPETEGVAESTVFKSGDTGDGVKKLHDTMVELGYMTTVKIGTGYGKYGPQTTAAVKSLQKSLGFFETGRAQNHIRSIYSANRTPCRQP